MPGKRGTGVQCINDEIVIDGAFDKEKVHTNINKAMADLQDAFTLIDVIDKAEKTIGRTLFQQD